MGVYSFAQKFNRKLASMVSIYRRNLIRSTAALAAASALPMPAWARGQSLTHARNGFGEVSGEDIELAVGNHHFTTGGRSGHAFAVSRVAPRHSTSLQTSRATVGR